MEQKDQPHERIILHVCRVHHSVHYILSQLSFLNPVPVWQGLMTGPMLSQRASAFWRSLTVCELFDIREHSASSQGGAVFDHSEF